MERGGIRGGRRRKDEMEIKSLKGDTLKLHAHRKSYTPFQRVS